jgi:hypothetical protein
MGGVSNMRQNMAFIESQVYIQKDGFDIQTDIASFKTYYKRLGWSIVGQAPALPGFKDVPGHDVRDITPEAIEAINATAQIRMFE